MKFNVTREATGNEFEKVTVTAVPTHPEGSFIHGSLSAKELIIKPPTGVLIADWSYSVREDLDRPGVREFDGCRAEMPVSMPDYVGTVLVPVSEVVEVIPYRSVKSPNN